jgi:hypothetical protein
MNRFEKEGVAFVALLLGLLLAVVFAGLAVYVVQILWNYSLVPACSLFRELDYWQTAGLVILLMTFSNLVGVRVETNIKNKDF